MTAHAPTPPSTVTTSPPSIVAPAREHLAYEAERRVYAIDDATRKVGQALRAEAAAMDACADLLEELTNSIIGNPNPLTDKPHSASSAERAARLTGSYRSVQCARLAAEIARVVAVSDLECAKLTARLAVAAVEAQ